MIILAGFERYGRYSYNLSSEIVRNFKEKLDDYIIKKVFLPVAWKKCINLYKDILLRIENNPKLVILLGIFSNNSISIEKIAWNFAVGNDIENRVKFGLIKAYSKLYIKTGLDLKKIYSLLRNKIKIQISYYPGLYLCNYLYYWALYLSNKRYPVIFIHIPHNGKLNRYIQIIEIIMKLIIKLSN
jgi:pyrrolidone-carboxylate peptidase